MVTSVLCKRPALEPVVHLLLATLSAGRFTVPCVEGSAGKAPSRRMFVLSGSAFHSFSHVVACLVHSTQHVGWNLARSRTRMGQVPGLNLGGGIGFPGLDFSWF
jgi:hypothetical protein